MDRAIYHSLGRCLLRLAAYSAQFASIWPGRECECDGCEPKSNVHSRPTTPTHCAFILIHKHTYYIRITLLMHAKPSRNGIDEMRALESRPQCRSVCVCGQHFGHAYESGSNGKRPMKGKRKTGEMLRRMAKIKNRSNELSVRVPIRNVSC